MTWYDKAPPTVRRVVKYDEQFTPEAFTFVVKNKNKVLPERLMTDEKLVLPKGVFWIKT